MSQRKDVMLAKAITAPLLDKLPEQVIVQPKLNGRRFLAKPWFSPAEGRVLCLLYSSQGNAIESVPHINREFERIYNHLATQKWQNLPTFDGEFYVHGMPLQEISSIVSRSMTLHPNWEVMQAWVFDILGQGNQSERLQLLKECIPAVDYPFRPVIPLSSTMAYKEELISNLRYYVSDGYEGIIIRDPKALYKEGKQNCILKVKPRKEEWFKILGAFEAISKEDEPKGMLGGLNLLAPEGYTFRCGAGVFSWEERTAMWEGRKPYYLGRWACIRFPEKSARGIPLQPILMSIDEEKGERRLVGTILDME